MERKFSGKGREGRECIAKRGKKRRRIGRHARGKLKRRRDSVRFARTIKKNARTVKIDNGKEGKKEREEGRLEAQKNYASG